MTAMKAGSIIPQRDMLPVFLPAKLNSITGLVVIIEQAEVAQQKLIRRLRTRNGVQRYDAWSSNLSLLDIRLCLSLLCA